MSASAVRKPELLVITGPNGSGKSTITEDLLSHKWMVDKLYINPDEIAQNMGDWNDPELTLKAAKYAEELRQSCIAERKSFAFETVFSTEGKVDFLLRAKGSGYFARLFFIYTESPQINIRRVRRRVQEGGHTVPEDKIIKRYAGAFAQMEKVVGHLDRCYFYDNSVDEVKPRLLFRATDGRLEKSYTTDLPKWSVELHDRLAAAA